MLPAVEEESTEALLAGEAPSELCAGEVVTLRPGEAVGNMCAPFSRASLFWLCRAVVPERSVSPVSSRRYLVSRDPVPADNTAQAQLRAAVEDGDTLVELATLSRQVYDLCRLQVACVHAMERFPALAKLHSDTQREVLDDLDLKVLRWDPR